MATKVEFPIRAKLLLLVSAAVLIASGAYLALAVSLFKEDKASLIYELNAGNVKTLAAETEASLGKVADKVKLLVQGHGDQAWIRSVFEAEPDLIAYTLYKPSGEAVATVRNSQYLKLYGLESSEIDRVREKAPVPFEKVLSSRTWVVNSTLPGGAPILSLALALEIQGKGLSGEYVAVADLRMDSLLKLLSEKRIATVYVVDSEGRVIAHPDAAVVTGRMGMQDIPIVREAVQSPVALGVKKFEWKGTEWLGAHAAVGIGGLRVISQVEEAQAFRAARRLIEKSVLFALFIVTAALLLSGRVARGLTDPIERLVDATERLSRWQFGESIHVKSRDEIANLARSFNSMAADLQNQRRQLESAREELELKVKERTAALEQQKKQLAEAQDSLIRTTRLASLGELAGSAAHEVLNPLNNINIRVERIRDQLRDADRNDSQLLEAISQGWKKAFAEGGWKGLESELSRTPEGAAKPLIEEDLENLSSVSAELSRRMAERSEDMEFLGREVSRISRIINNMRSLSRVGGERKPVDVHVPIEETIVTLADLFEKRKIALVKEFSADSRDLFAVVSDKDELVQVFANLLRNSLHAVGEANRRAGEIRISTRRQGDRVEVRIQDNGTGIAADNLGRVFEPSFTTKSVEEGTGLGLSISRRLVRAFGGDIEVESARAGEGTTFLIWFPAAT